MVATGVSCATGDSVGVGVGGASGDQPPAFAIPTELDGAEASGLISRFGKTSVRASYPQQDPSAALTTLRLGVRERYSKVFSEGSS